MSLKDDLMTLATTFTESKGWMLSSLGQRVRSDRNFFVTSVPAGRFTVTSGEQAFAWFAANWPNDLPWPKGIAQPAKQGGKHAVDRRDGAAR